MFKATDFSKVFPTKSFGRYFEDDISHSKVFSLACTPEISMLVSVLRGIQATKDSPFDLAKFVLDSQDAADFDEALAQFENYQGIYRLLARDFRDAMVRRRGESFVYNKMGDSYLFDTVLHVIVRHMSKDIDFRLALAQADSRKAIFESLMQQILDRTEEEFATLKEPSIWLRDLKYLIFEVSKYEIKGREAKATDQLKEFVIDLRKIKDHMDELPVALKDFSYKEWLGLNSGIMLYGDRGSGKSGTLNFITTWAWKNNWLILSVPSVHRLTQEEIAFQRHEESRLYLQPQLATEFLNDFVKTNEHLLDKIAVDLSIYGHFNFSGCHDHEPIAVPNTFDEWTQTHFYDSDKFLLNGEMQAYVNDQRHWRTRLREKLPEPKTLLDLCKYAEKDPEYTTNVIAEVIEQLREQEVHPVLTVVDDYNYFFRRSVYPSYRYDNKKLKGFIPAYHMALCRLMMRMDGHRFKNGFKLTASSNYHLYKHTFNPDKINQPRGFSMQMTGLRLNYFRNAIYHYTNTNMLQEAQIDERLVQQYYAESQGLWGNLIELLRNRQACVHIRNFKFNKREFLAEEASDQD